MFKSGLPERTVSQALVAFKKVDVGGKGAIVDNELKAALKAMGINAPDHTMQHLTNLFDANSDGVIDIDEFLQMIKHMKSYANKNRKASVTNSDNLASAFAALGGNDDKTGSISIQKLQNMINIFDLNVNSDDLSKLTHMDKNNNGRCEFTQFQELFEETGINLTLPN